MITVPIAQSIRFRPVNSDLFNFDNTANGENRFIQSVAAANLPIQIICPDDGSTLCYLYLIHGTTRTLVTAPTPTTIGQNFYYTYLVPCGTYPNEICYLEAEDQTPPADAIVRYRSERFTIEAQPTYFKLEWYNSENAFLLDYTTLVNQIWLNARLDELSYGGDISVYSNQGEDTILKSIVSRIFSFKCDVPDYIAEQLTLALAHDHFCINEIEFVALKKPTLKQLGMSKMYTFTVELKQKTIIGINSHDIV